MADRQHFSGQNFRSLNENLRSSRRPRRPRRPNAQRPSTNEDFNPPRRDSRNARDDTSDSSSEEGLGAFITSYDRESDSDWDSDSDPTRMGGSRRAAEEGFGDVPARRAEQGPGDALRGGQRTGGRRRRGGGTYGVQHGDHEGQLYDDRERQLFDRLHELDEAGRDQREYWRNRGWRRIGHEWVRVPQAYEDRGFSARGDDDEDGNPFPYSPQGYGDRVIGARPDEYDDHNGDDYGGRLAPRGHGGGGMGSRHY